jgi:hypothetical protein
MEVTFHEDPWPGIAVHGTPIAYHESSAFRELLLLFDGAGAADDATLRAAGMSPGRPMPLLRGRNHRMLRSAAGLAITLLA